jgi:catechol 2,3-dioxygenase-like lactoylglutathione lyase family enzyme
MQGAQLRYVIKFVADMDKAVKFHRDVLGLKVKFESPGWSEFATGETTLALHPASDKNPAGKVELGFTVPDVETFYRDMTAKGVLFTMPPKKQDFGGCWRSLSIPRAHIAVWGLRRRSRGTLTILAPDTLLALRFRRIGGSYALPCDFGIRAGIHHIGLCSGAVHRSGCEGKKGATG